MKTSLSLLASLLLAASTAAELPPRGPLPAEQQDLIHLLAANHKKLKRAVEPTQHGYRSRTTSDDPELVAALITHVRYMKRRLDSGGRVRNWDPAFREMAAYHDRLETTLRELPDGLELEVVGTDAAAAAVARNHAHIVSGFVAEGQAAVDRKHDPAHPDDQPDQPDQRRQGRGQGRSPGSK
jgi:hypothetical protein